MQLALDARLNGEYSSDSEYESVPVLDDSVDPQTAPAVKTVGNHIVESTTAATVCAKPRLTVMGVEALPDGYTRECSIDTQFN
jgi:hypothetical protein